jgi:hypothetical protein
LPDFFPERCVQRGGLIAKCFLGFLGLSAIPVLPGLLDSVLQLLSGRSDLLLK